MNFAVCTCIAILAFATVVSAEPVAKPLLFNSPVNPGMALDTMESFNKNINAKAIKNHGCHCAKYSRTDNIGGLPVDELDSACLDWNKKLRCVTLEGGACENGIEFTSFPIQLQPNGKLSEDAIFACAFAGDKCAQAVCKIAYDWGMQLWDSVGKNGPGSYKYKEYVNAQCMPEAPVPSEKVCVGEAPDVLIVEKPLCQNIGASKVEYAPKSCPGLGCNAGGQHPDCRFCSMKSDKDKPWNMCKGEEPNDVVDEEDDNDVCEDIGGQKVEYAPESCPGLGCNAGGQHPDCRFCSTSSDTDKPWNMCKDDGPVSVCQDIGGQKVEYAPDFCPGLGCNAGGQHPDCRFCSIDPNDNQWHQCI